MELIISTSSALALDGSFGVFVACKNMLSANGAVSFFPFLAWLCWPAPAGEVVRASGLVWLHILGTVTAMAARWEELCASQCAAAQIPLIPPSLRLVYFPWKDVGFLLNVFSLPNGMTGPQVLMIFSINEMEHVCWFMYVRLSLCPRDKSIACAYADSLCKCCWRRFSGAVEAAAGDPIAFLSAGLHVLAPLGCCWCPFSCTRWWLEYLGSCHLCGERGWSSQLLA